MIDISSNQTQAAIFHKKSRKDENLEQFCIREISNLNLSQTQFGQ